jgi:hypothetical protein
MAFNVVPLDMKDFRANMLLACLLLGAFIKTAEGNEDLVTRMFRLEQPVVIDGNPLVATEVRQWLEGRGVTFDAGAKISISDGQRHLISKNTPLNQQLIAALLDIELTPQRLYETYRAFLFRVEDSSGRDTAEKIVSEGWFPWSMTAARARHVLDENTLETPAEKMAEFEASLASLLTYVRDEIELTDLRPKK